MNINLETVIWFIFFLDAIANVVFSTSKGFNNWYINNFPKVSRQFPLSLGWSLLYLFMTIWVGLLIYRLQFNWVAFTPVNLINWKYFIFYRRSARIVLNCGPPLILWNLKQPVCMEVTRLIQLLSQEPFLFIEPRHISSKIQNMLPSFLRFKSWGTYILD